MVNKIFLSHSMSFVKLTVDFYVTHTHTHIHTDSAVASALIQFQFVTIQFLHISFGENQIEIFIYRAFDTLFGMPVHVFAIYVSIASAFMQFEAIVSDT